MTAPRQSLVFLVGLTLVGTGIRTDATPSAAIPLIEAAKSADLEAARAELARAADPSVTEPDGTTALHWAVHLEATDVVDVLLDAGADATATNRYGIAPLSLAAETGNASIVERLLTRGADANTVMPGGETALMTAARSGSAAAVRVLLTHGGDPNAREEIRGQTALMWAAGRNNIEVIHALAELGADVHARTESPPRPPSRRTFSDPPPTGFTALAFAARGGHIDAVRVLLEAGADANATLSDGQSALVVAAANANWELMDYMLDRGADPNLAGAGWNALHQTVRTRRMNVGFGTPGPIPSGTVDSIDIIRKLIAHGVDIDARMTTDGMKDGQRNRLNRLGATAFFLASKVTDTDAMRVLREAGADPLMPTADGTTPLMVAAGLAIWNPGEDGGSLPGQENEVLEAVRLLVELGNDLNATNYRGETPLHGAAFRGANVVVEYLVEQGARLDARTFEHGWTPLAIAAGLSYSDFYKAQIHTAVLLTDLMEAQGLPTDGHVVDGSVCYDCLQTRSDQIEAWIARENRMEAVFDPATPVIAEDVLAVELQP